MNYLKIKQGNFASDLEGLNAMDTVFPPTINN